MPVIQLSHVHKQMKSNMHTHHEMIPALTPINYKFKLEPTSGLVTPSGIVRYKTLLTFFILTQTI